MKLRMILGLLLAGSPFVGTALQAQDTQDLPSSITAVSVECNGGCNDNTLGDICSLAGTGHIPIGVACNDVADRTTSIACPGSGNNRCNVTSFSPNVQLNRFCQDSGGWDVVVFCALP
jgi:hypothetical protein